MDEHIQYEVPKMPIVHTVGLTKSYGIGAPALANVSIDIMPGRIVGLLGPNGSGKTTLIKILNGLLVPTSGEVYIDGYKPGKYTKSIVSYLPDRNYIDENEKVRQLIDMFETFYRDFNPNLAYQMLHDLGIDPEQNIKTLSKGTREKVQLILVMSRNAKLYILDEPIAGVDPAARDYILKTILGNYNREASILISTHLISDIETILDDVILIHYGDVVEQNSADNIRNRTGRTIDQYFREVFAC